MTCSGCVQHAVPEIKCFVSEAMERSESCAKDGDHPKKVLLPYVSGLGRFYRYFCFCLAFSGLWAQECRAFKRSNGKDLFCITDLYEVLPASRNKLVSLANH